MLEALSLGFADIIQCADGMGEQKQLFCICVRVVCCAVVHSCFVHPLE